MDTLLLALITHFAASVILWLASMLLGDTLNWLLESIRQGPKTPKSVDSPAATVVRSFQPKLTTNQDIGKVEYKGPSGMPPAPRTSPPASPQATRYEYQNQRE